MHLVYFRLLGLAIGACLIGWLVLTGSPSRWAGSRYVQEESRSLNPDESRELLREITGVAAAAGITDTVRLNQPWRSDALNVYIVEHRAGVSAGDARYFPCQDLILVDAGIVWPSASSVPFAGLSVTESTERSNVARPWFQFALLHELGHQALHAHRCRQPSDDKAADENEADLFAFEPIVKLIDQEGGRSIDEGGLFHPGRIRQLPEPDRSIATIAAMIQAFSVNLLFSSTEFSTFHEDEAHAAFVARFKPALAKMLADTTTRDGKVYVTLALASLDRVSEAGRSIVKEIRSEAAVQGIQFEGEDLLILISDTQGTRRARLAVDQLLQSPGPYKLSSGAVGATGAAEQSADWWASEPRLTPEADAVTDDQLIEALLRAYYPDDEKPPCGVNRGSRHDTSRDVVIVCRGEFFSGTYDTNNGVLSDIEPLRAPTRAQGEVVEVVDYREADERRTYFVHDSLRDGPHTAPHELSVYHPLEDRIPLARTPLLTDWIPTGSKIMDWFRITHPPTLICHPMMGDVVCVEFVDSIFRFSPKSNSLSVLFYPAGAKMKFDGQGLYAFYAPGGRRIFLAK